MYGTSLGGDIGSDRVGSGRDGNNSDKWHKNDDDKHDNVTFIFMHEVCKKLKKPFF